MSPFGPFYPPRLQASVNHSERLVRVLSEEEGRSCDARHVAAWLIGRAGELERFVEALVTEWRDGGRSAEASAAALDAYLATLHEGLARRLGVTGPRCCAADNVTTETPPRRDDGRALLETIDRLLSNLVESPAGPPRPPTTLR